MQGKVLIIGIGNPIRGDDGLGWQAARSLEKSLTGRYLNVDVLVVQQLTMDLVDDISDANLVVFIDAELGDPPGHVKQKEILAGTSLAQPGSHFFDPKTLLSAVQALYGTHPRALLFSLTTRAFEYGEDLSNPIQVAMPGFIDQIQEAILTVELPQLPHVS